MPTNCKKFGSLVQGCILRMEKDVVFFKDAQSADVSDGIPRRSLFEDLPFQCVSYSLSFEFVDVLHMYFSISTMTDVYLYYIVLQY